MTKNISVVRTAPYNYSIAGCNLYESFNQVAKKMIDPPILASVNLLLIKKITKENSNFETVYCSPRKRSVQTAQLFSQNPTILPELSEVCYEMENFIEPDSFFSASGTPQVQRARIAFVYALVNNKLEETYQQVINRIESFLKIISKQKSNNKLIFSHGFIMKIMEAYIQDQSIKDTPSKLLQYFDGKSETFHFLEGFSFKLD